LDLKIDVEQHTSEMIYIHNDFRFLEKNAVLNSSVVDLIINTM